MSNEDSGGDPDRQWFEDLYRQHHAAVLAYAQRRVDDADDVVSEVFTAAWRARGTVPDPALPWLFRTASNHVMHVHRSSTRRQRLTARLRSDCDDVPLHQSDEVASIAITTALSHLTPADQELLRLSAWEELTIGELAFVLGCSAGTVRVRLYRARTRLAAQLRAFERSGATRPLLADSTSTREITS